jgi:heterodisulfide reductase subunit A
MVDAGRHPNITLLTYAEVQEVSGYIGNFKVKVLKQPQYVIADRCTGCGLCPDVCPIEVPNEFEEGIAPRKAIYVPQPQAVPLVYTVDLDHCIKCYKCVEACGSLHAIDFSQEPEEIELDVGTIIVATGYDLWDPSPITEYGYGQHENIITTLELERLLSESGPTNGRCIRPSDGQIPKSVAFVQCVGSRDSRYHEYCSGFCCMYTIKNAIVFKEKYPESDVYIFYIDIRTPSKGYEEFYQRALHMGIKFIQGRPAEIAENSANGNLVIRAEDRSLGRLLEAEMEMVVLSPAAVPREGATALGQALTISKSPDGFYMEYHPKLRPIDTATEGVFLAGAAQGPKDIPASVAQGSAAAARAGRVMAADTWEIDPIVAYVWPDRCKECGVCVDKCPYGAIIGEKGQIARIVPAKCHGCGCCVAECPHNAITQMHFSDAQILAQIHALLAEKPEEKILAFMCHWCSSMGADGAGTSHFEYPASSRGIRVMCSARQDHDFIYEAFRLGAGMVLASGCHPQDCHYITGQQHAAKRFDRIPKALERMGISPERFRVEWISAAEGQKYAQVITEMDETLRALGTEQIKAENEKARPQIEKRLRRWIEVPGVAEVLGEEVEGEE